MISYGIMQGRLTPSNGRGIQFFPFENWENEFESASVVGLQEIEFIFDYENYESNPLWTDKGLNKLKHVMGESGIKINSLCFDYFMRRPFYKALEENRGAIRQENKEFLLKMFKSMSIIGGNLIEIPSVDNSSMKTEEEKSLYRDFLKEIIDETKTDYGHIRIGLETDLPVEEFVKFIDSVESTRVGANYDSGNSSGLGYDLYEEVTGLKQRILNIHIKDRVYKGTTVELGTGSADFDALFKGLNEIGYNGSFIIQAARGNDGEEEKTIDSQRSFIEKYVGRYDIGK